MIRHRPRRRGMAMLLTIACLTLLIAVFAVLLRLAWFGRAQVQTQQRRVQADWLAESGLERAAFRLADSTDYRGEIWEISADDLGGPDAARIRIVVEASDQPDRRRVHIVADYPIEPPHRVRRTKQAVVSLRPPTNALDAENAP